jgi:hypothetical protein
MKTIGFTNPILLIIGLYPLYLFHSFLGHMGQDLFAKGIGSYILFLFLVALFVFGPLFLLTLLRFIIIDNDKIKVIYLFRLTAKTYSTNELKSVFTQKMFGNSAFPFDFYQTYLYFGKEKRIKFNALEFINYPTLRKRTEKIEKAANR